MELYYWKSFRSVRAIWLIKELGVEGDFKYIRLKPHGPETEACQTYEADVNPHGSIPALTIKGGNPIIESGAICLFLVNKYNRLGPDDTNTSEFYNWIVYATATLDSVLVILYVHWYIDSTKYTEEQISKTIEKWTTCLDYLTKTLADKREFICGSSFTAADCVLGYNMAWANFMKGDLLKKHPEVEAYFKKLTSRKAFQEAMDFE